MLTLPLACCGPMPAPTAVSTRPPSVTSAPNSPANSRTLSQRVALATAGARGSGRRRKKGWI
eukprot:4236718-Pyramimonas_sp.AAC.1